MERKEITNNLKSKGAIYRCNGIVFAASENMTDEETIQLLRSLKSNTVWMLGRQVGWYAIAALDMLGAEKYTGSDPDIAQKAISRESIKQKLGFDPMNPPALRTAPHEVDDNSPSIWAPLTTEERIFVYELRTGKKAPAELLSESGERLFYDKAKKHKEK